ncbi:MAG: phosphoglycerate kinase [Atribacterota bacterium]|nr:phosphoglycerate kinase [Atribacterota bacterium]MDD4897004.1 phosphoglycerate kinase [Atribacterota bacterium]MDD5636455.1 phosphoglycerate kinase [Atribacterota bacterium]
MIKNNQSLSLLEDLKREDLEKKRIIVRVDFNVPLSDDSKVEDDTRIRAAVNTIEYLLINNCIVILMSHLGRPNGTIVEKMRLNAVAQSLENILQRKIIKLSDCIGDSVQKNILESVPGDIILLENLRFHKEEENNDPVFAQQLSSLADIYINDAFGSAHRAHASTVGIASYLPAYAGFLMAKEIKSLDKLIINPEKPFVSIIGGAKVSDKIEILDRLVEISDTILIGGGMAYTFIVAQGFKIGKSILEENRIDYVKKLLSKAKESGKKIVIPEDVLVASDFSADSDSYNVSIEKISKNMFGMDIGINTIDLFKKIINNGKTIFWNGPLGVFEIDKFAHGTNEIAKQIASLYGRVFSVIGGGDSIAAINKLSLDKKFSHISTGGGASLEYVAGRKLPGIEVLRKKDEK